MKDFALLFPELESYGSIEVAAYYAFNLLNKTKRKLFENIISYKEEVGNYPENGFTFFKTEFEN